MITPTQAKILARRKAFEADIAKKALLVEDTKSPFRTIKLKVQQPYKPPISKDEKRINQLNREKQWNALIRISHEVVHKYKELDVTHEALLSDCRDMTAVFMRWECFYRSRIEARKTLPAIAEYFNKHETTVHSGVERYKYLQQCLMGDAKWPKGTGWIRPEWIVGVSDA